MLCKSEAAHGCLYLSSKRFMVQNAALIVIVEWHGPV
jgi:hypothetical protein